MSKRAKKKTRKAFSGDFDRELPKGKREPYRLWFEYLKFAQQDSSPRVDRDLYRPWGDVVKCEFDSWWEQHWKSLFAVPASVSVISSSESALTALTDPDAVLVRISRSGAKTRIERDFKTLTSQVLTGLRTQRPVRAQFVLSTKRSMNTDALRAMLKFLQLLRKHKTLEEATEVYCNWAKDWNNGITPESGRKPIHVPQSLLSFKREIDQHRTLQASSPGRVKQSTDFNAARGNVARLHRNALKVLHNVQRGIFPGRI